MSHSLSHMSINVTFKGNCLTFGGKRSLLPCRELVEKIDTAHVSAVNMKLQPVAGQLSLNFN